MNNQDFILFSRSLLFYFGFWALSCVGVLLLMLLFFTNTDTRRKIAAKINDAIIYWLGVCCNIEIKVSGLENIKNTPTIYLSNHQSTGETIILQSLLHPLSVIAKKELLFVPLFGWGLYLTDPIIIDRTQRRNALKKVLKQGVNQISKGSNVLIFPQGTRVPYGKKGEFSGSGAALAIESNTEIVPVAHNVGKYWKQSFIKKPGVIHVHIGPSKSPSINRKELMKKVEAWIANEMDAIG